MAGLINKVKDTLTGHHTSPGTTDTTHDTSATGTTGLTGSSHSHGVGSTGTTGTTGTGGPHTSNLANRADPRVDSDGDGRPDNLATSRATGPTGTGTTGTGLTGTGQHSTSGPHSSNILNKMDPRVDSDNDGSRTGLTGTRGGSGLANIPAGINPDGVVPGATHDTITAEKLDPHVSGLTGTGIQTYPPDSGVTGSGVTGSSSGLTGSSTTRGPHASNVANKVDPRVDSDGDGSRLH